MLRPVVAALLAAASTACIGDLWPTDDEPIKPCRFEPPPAPSADAEHILIDATARTSQLISLGANGTGSDYVGSIELTAGLGTVTFGCTQVSVAVFAATPGDGDSWFHALGVAGDRLYPLWLVCAEGRLTWVLAESTDGTGPIWERGSGSCDGTDSRVSSELSFPGVDLQLGAPLTGYTIEGSDISLASDGTGSLVVDSVDHRMLAFTARRCAVDCDVWNWAEIHALILDPTAARASFAVLNYEIPGNEIRIDRTITLPGFVDDFGAVSFAATVSEP